MRARIEWLWPVLVVAGIVAIGLLAFPYLVSAYHLEAGGRAMQGATLRAEESQRAIDHLNQSVAWDSGNAQAYRLLARVYRAIEDWPAAVEALTHYIELRPEHPLGYLELAGLYNEIDTRRDKAIERDLAQRITGAWRSRGHTQAGLIDLAKAAQTAGRTEEALVWLWRAIALDPKVGDAWNELGLWYQEHELWTEAVHSFERALEINHFERVGASDPAYHAGLLYQTLLDPSDLDRAWSLYDSALTVNQFSTPAMLADCHYQRGEILRMEEHSIEESITAFELAIAANPQHAWAHARLGQAYYQRDGDVAAAEAELKQAIALAPKDKWIYVILGDFYRLAGREEQARTAYEQALAIDPDLTGAHARLQTMGNEQ